MERRTGFPYSMIGRALEQDSSTPYDFGGWRAPEEKLDSFELFDGIRGTIGPANIGRIVSGRCSIRASGKLEPEHHVKWLCSSGRSSKIRNMVRHICDENSDFDLTNALLLSTGGPNLDTLLRQS